MSDVPILKDTDRSTGRGALQKNIQAALALAGAVRSTLGPRGLDKLLIDDDGRTMVTNDGVTVLESAKVEVWNEGHPLLDVVQPTSSEQASAYDLVLLPGSRAQELDHHLDVMVDAAEQGAAQGLWSLQNVVVAGAPGRARQLGGAQHLAQRGLAGAVQPDDAQRPARAEPERHVAQAERVLVSVVVEGEVLALEDDGGRRRRIVAHVGRSARHGHRLRDGYVTHRMRDDSLPHASSRLQSCL